MLAYLDFWDYVTFATLFILGAAGVISAIFVLGLPGRIAIARKQPEAEAVNLMGWAGFLTVSEGVKMYQLNEVGLIVGVSITGAKYYKDKELN
jgi:hypothetical protein